MKPRRDQLVTGRVRLFSREFLEDLPRRFTGPGRLRFILQPTLATVLRERRGELARSGLATIGNLLAAGIVLDLVFQLILYRTVHPGAALVVGPILICAPYALARALTNRVEQWSRGRGTTS